ncbi:maleylacetoacetate isomerase maia [Talaromyces proteolyticus]|uniref:Maleylacetoacetate isomerase maia n=1 Tax=Talaromyces proteolyticus TaxID=1131652 RepID=A0AAD4Q3H7_9EURO|nr:maleylacetoacetate isomerase maia [Talaromyces proteolyticus]KAH8705054.1 maleylacetoacetate isomerase maia [Talaromyces proteolyticus]
MGYEQPTYELYTYFRSSCSARLRIALNLHDIPYKAVYVHLLKNEQLTDEHRAINPSLSVPVLVVHKSAEDSFAIPQSTAALEYLEENTASNSHYRPLLPKNPELRAVTRTLVAIISADIQPVVNLRVQRGIKELGADPNPLCRQTTEAGFAAYEAVASKVAGAFSVGDDITLADVCLVPAVWSAARFGVNVNKYPTIARVAARMEEEDAVKRAHWRNQPDTPEEFRQP